MRLPFMRVTVTQLADMWRAAAQSLEVQDAPLVNRAKAEQLRACAKDLEDTHIHHELVKDNPLSKTSAWLKRLK